MLVKAVFFFLLIMVAIALLSNVVAPGALGRMLRRNLPIGRMRPCPRCGARKPDCVCGGK